MWGTLFPDWKGGGFVSANCQASKVHRFTQAASLSVCRCQSQLYRDIHSVLQEAYVRTSV